MYAIKTEKLTKKYGRLTAVDGLDLAVKQGELLALLGVNGAGKTTTIKMLSCLTAPTAGDAFVCGKSISSESGQVKKLIAVSPQETAVAPNLTAEENLLLMAGVSGFGKKEAEEKTSAIAEKLGLISVLGKKAGKLSGGWQRRLSIAMALICRPQVLFLDEPTLGLDVIARSELWELIKGLKESMTIILTTHYMEEAESLSDRVAIMAEGRLKFVGTPAEIKAAAETDSFEKAFIKIAKGGRV